MLMCVLSLMTNKRYYNDGNDNEEEYDDSNDNDDSDDENKS